MSTGFEQQALQGENHGHASKQAFEVHLPGPLDLPASSELFRSKGDDLIDRWDGVTLSSATPENAPISNTPRAGATQGFNRSSATPLNATSPDANEDFNCVPFQSLKRDPLNATARASCSAYCRAGFNRSSATPVNAT